MREHQYNAAGTRRRKKPHAQLPKLGSSASAPEHTINLIKTMKKQTMQVKVSDALRIVPKDGMLDQIRLLLQNYLPFVRGSKENDILQDVQDSILWSVYNRRIDGSRIIQGIAASSLGPAQRALGVH